MRRLLPFFAFAAFLGALPLAITNEYYLNVLVFIGIHAIIVLGLDLLMGYTGQISLGHAGFFGLGAYVAGVLSARWGWSPLPELLVALPGVALVAWLVGIPTLRLSGHYLAMATLGFGIILYILFQELDTLTGGPSGLTGISGMRLFGVKVADDRSFYYLTAACLLLCLLVSLNLVRSRVGRALRAIHGSEVGAAALGVDTARFKVGVFVLSAVFAGLAGWLYAHYVTFISPGSFGFGFSVKLVTMVVIGSLGSLWGAIFGAALLTALPEFLAVFAEYDILVFGALLMVVMVFMPRGFLRGVEDGVIALWRRARRPRTVGKRA